MDLSFFLTQCAFVLEIRFHLSTALPFSPSTIPKRLLTKIFTVDIEGQIFIGFKSHLTSYHFAKLGHKACCCLPLLFQFVFPLSFPLLPSKFTLGVPALKRVPESTLGSEHPVEHQNILPPEKEM